MDEELIVRYNYDSFTPEKFKPWMRWDSSPEVGSDAHDFPLWDSESREETSLKRIWSANSFTVAEFGSFT
jgi:hypothetical protein